MSTIYNIHEREIEADADVIGGLLDGLGRPGDRFWPSPAWLPIKLDRQVAVGADGGHGPVRYHVTDHEPGRRVRFEFDPELGLRGYHEFTVKPTGAASCVIRHELVGTTTGTMTLLWPVAVRWMHDAVLEDLLDNAEQAGAGTVQAPATWSRWARFLHRFLEFPKPRKVEVPEGARLARRAFDRVDRQDAWQVSWSPGMPRDPQVWADAVFSSPPTWVGGLLRIRNALVRFVGIEKGDPKSFDTLDRSENELLLGTDERHLDFRGSVLVDDESVTLSTVVRINNRRGHLYMALVWLVHGLIVRAMLHRARRSFALQRIRDFPMKEAA